MMKKSMNYPRIADLTVAEFKELLREKITQSVAYLLGDPDEGLAEELR